MTPEEFKALEDRIAGYDKYIRTKRPPMCEGCGVLHKMRFEMGKRREEQITAELAVAVIAKAHDMNLPMIARAQAFQFELTLRQKDVIGEWVPANEPGYLVPTGQLITDGKFKWVAGIRAEEIDSNFILRHMTNKKQKPIEKDLRLAPMIMGELARFPLPPAGPIILDADGLPYNARHFREVWRKVARAAGVPDNVWSMDSRAGAITEAIDAGARLEDVRRDATHSDIGMTQRYDRGDVKASAKVMKIRAEGRNKSGTDGT